MADDDANTSEPKDEKCVSFTYTTYSSDFHVIDNTNEENISLQEAFRKYREAKQNELRQARMLKKRQELRKADPKKMAALRQKFVNQAKKYYGYPYARKYWPPDSPEYKSKLFLDCCGLVRRVMRDLQDDFGFIIGPWNQAYMFDTLPIEVKSEKDMKPGDLVFISATYYNPKSKKQRHNMTHVEIWAGEGNKTIGARWNNGKVKLFDSYKFTAKSYHSETYHFRSLDTWLKGICRSHCSQHSWRRSKYNPSKKSIFSIPDQAEQDEAAGDDNDNVDNFTVRGNTFIDEVTGISKMVKDYKLASAERPKSDMDLRHVHSDSSLPSAKSHAIEPANFPAIKNNLGVKGKNVSSKKKRCQNERREGDVNDVKEGAASANRSEDGSATGKPLGQFAISSSLTDLGKKGFYLKDLVDSTKAGSKGEMIDSSEENGEVDDDNDDVEGASGDDSDDDYLSKGSDEDFDDDYFIFVKDENASDVEDNDDVGANDGNDDENVVDEKVSGEELSAESEKVTDSSTNDDGKRKGEAYNISEECKVIENDGKRAKEVSECGEGHVEKGSNDELPEESHNADSGGVSEIGERNELKVRDDCIAKSDENAFDEGSGNKSEAELEEMNVKEGLERADSEALVCGENVKSDIISSLEDESHDSATDCDKDSKMEDKAEADVIKTVNQSSASSVGFMLEHSKDCDANTNENANPEITEQVDSNKAQKMKSECVKPSIVTMVTQGGHSSQPHAQSSMQTPILPAENTSSISRPVSSRTTQSSGSNSSCETDYRMNSSRGADTETPSDTTEDTIGTESAGKRGRGKKSPGGLKATKLPSCSLPSNMTPTFYVGGGNGTSLVEAPLVGLGWKRITDKFDERFRLKWVECKSRINYGSFREGEQLVNHVPNSHLLTNKLGLLNSLKEYERVTLSTKGRLPRLRMADFHPETYKLDEKSDRELFLEVYKDNEIWICKPVGMNQGKGIFLIRTREEINQILEEREQKKQQAQKPGRPLMNRIVQRYIMNPLLLDGRKFDVRAYMLVASTVPFLILYHKGYVRLTCMKYSTEDTNLGTHLTNQFVQKKDPNYKELKEDTAWSMDKFNDYINEHVRPDCPVEIEEDWVYNTFTKQMQKIMIHCFNSVKHKLQSRIGFFDLFGLDFMVDTEMKVHLIEVNTNPALHCNCEALKEVIPGVVEETLYVAIECFEKSKKNLQLMPLQSLKNFTILYCGTRANSIAPRSIRSVSPVKENSTADKSKTSGIGGQRRASSPTRQGQRSLTQSTPLYNTNQRRPSEKNDSSNKDSSANSASVKSGKTSSNVKTALSAKPRSDNKTKEDNNGNLDKVSKETTNTDSEATEDNKDKEIKTPPKSRGSTVIVDTLSKTTDSLNEATSALGKITQSLNQGSLTDSLLEEVKLKMTHAETTNASGGTVPNSTPPTRERENLERGN